MNEDPFSSPDEPREAIYARRRATLLGVWEFLTARRDIDPEKVRLSTYLLDETIERYLRERNHLQQFSKIPGRLQPPKIAGLMTEAIVRLRPVIPLVDYCDSEDQINANEILAIYNGIAICAERPVRNGRFDLGDEEWFDKWFKKFVYLLHHRETTAESLIFIYETLCWFRGPENFDRDPALAAEKGV